MAEWNKTARLNTSSIVEFDTNRVKMAKKLTIGPLGEHNENWLIVWAALLTKSKAILAKEVVGLQVRRHKVTIQELLEEAAQFRGMNPEDLFSALLTNPRYLEDCPANGDYNKKG